MSWKGAGPPIAARLQRGMTLPWFDVHQNVGNFLVNGGQDEQEGKCSESAVHDGIQAGSRAVGAVHMRQSGVQRLGVPDSSLWNWLRLSRLGRLETGHAKAAEARRPVSELESENARLRVLAYQVIDPVCRDGIRQSSTHVALDRTEEGACLIVGLLCCE